MIVIERSRKYKYAYYVKLDGELDPDVLIRDLEIEVKKRAVADDYSYELFETRVSRLKLGRAIGSSSLLIYGGALPHLVKVLTRRGARYIIRELPSISFRGHARKYWLRDYQFEAVERWRRRMLMGTIVLPTGAGKTLIGVEAIRLARARSLVLVPTVELAVQWRSMILEYLDLDEDRVGIVGGGRNEWRDITIATYHSAQKHIDYVADHSDLLILDEAHRVPAATFRRAVLKCRARMRLGLTPSLYRDDGNEHLVESLVGEVVYRRGYSELASRDYLAPLRYFLLTGRLSRDEVRAMRDARAYARIEHLGSGRNVARVVESTYENEIAKSAAWKLRAVAGIVERELPRARGVFIFSDYYSSRFSRQARDIYELLERRLGGEVEIVHDGLPARKRSSILEEFRSGGVKVLIATRILDEGIDVPDADVEVIASTTSSVRQFIQRIGRVVRPRPGKVARVYDLVTLGTRDRDHALRRLEMAEPIYDIPDIRRALKILKAHS